RIAVQRDPERAFEAFELQADRILESPDRAVGQVDLVGRGDGGVHCGLLCMLAWNEYTGRHQGVQTLVWNRLHASKECETAASAHPAAAPEGRPAAAGPAAQLRGRGPSPQFHA